MKLYNIFEQVILEAVTRKDISQAIDGDFTENGEFYINRYDIEYDGDENNADDGGSGGSNQYIDDLNFTIISKIAISAPDVSPDNVPFEQSQLVSKMRDDIKKRFSSPAYMCDQREAREEIVFKPRTLRYIRSRNRIEIEENKYSTFRLECDFVVKYELENRDMACGF